MVVKNPRKATKNSVVDFQWYIDLLGVANFPPGDGAATLHPLRLGGMKPVPKTYVAEGWFCHKTLPQNGGEKFKVMNVPCLESAKKNIHQRKNKSKVQKDMKIHLPAMNFFKGVEDHPRTCKWLINVHNHG